MGGVSGLLVVARPPASTAYRALALRGLTLTHVLQQESHKQQQRGREQPLPTPRCVTEGETMASEAILLLALLVALAALLRT